MLSCESLEEGESGRGARAFRQRRTVECRIAVIPDQIYSPLARLAWCCRKGAVETLSFAST